MTIRPPRHDSDSRDRWLECQEAMEAAIQGVMDEAVAAGWSEAEVVTAVMELANCWAFAQAARRDVETTIEAAMLDELESGTKH